MTCTILSSGAELELTCQNEHEEYYQTIKAELYMVLQSLYQEGYDKFWLTCERGIPLWAAELLCLMKAQCDVQLHIAVPYEEQTTNWNEELRDRYFKIHEWADSATLVNTQWHEACMQEAERYMLQRSDLLYVFGSATDQLHAVKTAEEIGVEVRFVGK